MELDKVIDEVSKEWATGKWTSIVIAIGETGNPSLGFVGGANQQDNGLENGNALRALQKAIQKGYQPIGIIATSEGKQHLLTLAGSGYSVDRDPNTGERSFVRYRTDA